MEIISCMTRALSLTLLLFVLAACGFRPLYGESTHPAKQLLASVAIDNIEDRNGQQLRLLLADRFYSTSPQTSARYRLTVRYTASKQELGIRRDDVATRARLALTGYFTLTPVDGSEPFKGSERSFVSYNILTDPYATSAAEQNATERGLTQLADNMTNRIALYLAGRDAD